MRNLKIKYILIICIIFFSEVTYGQQYVSDLSKWNAKRPFRNKTLFVVLHTTEGKDQSSLNTVKRSGTCNYFVATNGVIYTIINDKKVAKHAGVSMWCNRSNLSECSIGIEVSGWHNVKPTERQIIALKKLIFSLKKKYHLSDDKVVTHSMVAYGRPNKWYHFNHRGRKQCGMYFARPEIRRKLGLRNVFHVDPDVKARRLKIADFFLWRFIFGTGNEEVDIKPVIGVTQDKTDDDDAFEGLQEINSKQSIDDIAGNEYKLATTIYFFESGTIRTGKELSKEKFNFKDFPKGTKVLVGYIYCGKISASRTAYSAIGKKWNLPSTFYRLPDGTVKTGDDVDGDSLPAGTIFLFRK